MASPFKSRGLAAAAVAGISLALLFPAQAQFWDWGNRPQRQQQQPQFNNPFGGWGGRDGGWFGPQPQREAPVDYSQAPKPEKKKNPEATTNVLVVGDANADWLAYGLEDAYAEKPEIGVTRKHRTESGLIRYDQRRDAIEWPQAIREAIAAEKPKFIVMMIGNNDRVQIREKVPVAPKPGAPAAPKPGQPAQGAAPAAQQAAAPAPPAPPADPEAQPEEAPEQPPANLTPEQARQFAYGPWEFHTEKWELAYIRRIDATIAALKSAGVPVFWVGLPSQRGTKASADGSYLNEIYRSRADKAGIIYVDVWDGFVDEGGRFSPQGPDYEGQIRRLRSGDGVYFTKFGARKLAHYVEREIERSMANRGLPVALPMPVDVGPQSPNAKPGGPAARPVAGPVVPLNAVAVERDELIGGARTPARAPVNNDATVSRVLTKGEPIAAPTGRGDDFSWPRGGTPAAEPVAADPAATPAPTPANVPANTKKPAAATPRAGTTPADGQANQSTPANGEPKQQQVRRAPTNSNVPRPPLSIQGLFR
jgi:uncharacterized protein